MRIYLFTIDGTPGARTELHGAQAALEDHFRKRQDVSDVWWDDEDPYNPRLYLYGPTHADWASLAEPWDSDISFEEIGSVIFPLDLAEVPSEPPLSILDPAGARLSLSVTTRKGTETVTRVIPEVEWREAALSRGSILGRFAMDTALAMGIRWSTQEGS